MKIVAKFNDKVRLLSGILVLGEKAQDEKRQDNRMDGNDLVIM